MNKLYWLIVLLLACKICEGQNLVPNGDFEQDSLCPWAADQLYFASFWMNPATNIYNVSGTPDYFNSCCANPIVGVPVNYVYGYQLAHSGGAYSGICLWVYAFPLTNANRRDYIEAHLSSTLIANTCYHFQMFVNLANFSCYTSEALGVYFSNSSITGVNNWAPLPFTPQISYVGNVFDSLNWTEVSGNYTAQGGENFLIIGNFKNDSNTYTISTNLITCNASAFVYIDDVSLSPCTAIVENKETYTIKINPNPFMDKLKITVLTEEQSEIILFDIVSRKLLQQKFTNSVSLNTEQLVKGIYLYEVRNKNWVIKKGKVVKE
ncbi:MAG: T9SS type A sorting domain-containing protein [Bacteroidota bacterium]